MLQSITVRNLKGLNGEFQFAPITVITGENAVGKTALLQAVILDALGYIPALGRQQNKSRQLASGSIMRVESVHDGFTRNQTWTQARYTLTCVPENLLFTPFEMISLVEFFKMTADAKSQFLLRKVGHTEAISDIWTDMMRTMADLSYTGTDIDPIRDLATLENAAMPADEWLTKTIDTAKQRLSNVNSEVKGARAAVTDTSAMDASVPLEQTVTNRRSDIDAENKVRAVAQIAATAHASSVAAARATLDGLTTQGTTLTRKIAAAKADTAKRPACNRCGGPVECPACAASKTDKTVEITQMESEQVELRAKWQAQNKVLTDLQAATDTFNLPVRESDARLAALAVEQSKWDAAMGRQAAIAGANDRIDALVKRQEMLGKFVDTVTTKAGAILETAMKDTLNVANLLIKPVLGFDVTYNGENFGYLLDKQFVNLSTLSGSEVMVVNAGICMALTRQAPERVLLLDELGTMTLATKSRFIRVIQELIKTGVIHQMICVDPAWNFLGLADATIKIITIKPTNK